MVQSEVLDAIFRQSLGRLPMVSWFARRDFLPAGLKLDQVELAGETIRVHARSCGAAAAACPRCGGGLSALWHDLAPCPQPVLAPAGRSARAWPGSGVDPAGSPLSMPRGALSDQDLRGAVFSRCCRALRTTHRAPSGPGPAPRPRSRRSPGTGARRAASAAGQQGHLPAQRSDHGADLA